MKGEKICKKCHGQGFCMDKKTGQVHTCWACLNQVSLYTKPLKTPNAPIPDEKEKKAEKVEPLYTVRKESLEKKTGKKPSKVAERPGKPL